MFKEMQGIDVEMGEVNPEKIFNWANRHERFKQVTSDEGMLKKAFEEIMSTVKENEIHEAEDFTREICDEAIQMSFAIMFARAAVQSYFDGKSDEELCAETLDNQEWCKAAEDEAIKRTLDALIITALTMKEMKYIRLMEGIMSDDDDDLDEPYDGWNIVNIVQ